MVTSTNNPSPDKLAPIVHCNVQVICAIKGDLHTVTLTAPLEFFTQEIMVKGIRFMSDVPDALHEFVDKLRILEAKSKSD
jgi:hypothetical protein